MRAARILLPSPDRHRLAKSSGEATRNRTSKPRERLFAAARRVLAEKTIFDATVSDIVAEAGVAQGTFYIYFTDKYDLLKCLATKLVDELASDLQLEENRDLGRFERLECSKLVLIKRWQEHAPVFRAVFQLAMLREEFHQLRDQLQQPGREARRVSLRREQAEGALRPDIRPDITALAMARMVELVVMEWFGLGSSPVPGATPEDLARELARIEYHTMYPDNLG